MTSDDERRAAAAAALPDRIAFLGFGLIGGSIALALREAGSTAAIVAWTPSGNGPGAGRARGLVDAVAPAPEAALDGAGLVVLAGPPLAIHEAIGRLGAAWRPSLAPGATVTDVGSTKARIVAAADAAGLPFVGGHPMAGRETTGVESATAELFVDRPWVVVPGAAARPADVETVERLAVAVGARPRRLAADEHDRAVAAISHLPLVAAAALVESVAHGAAAREWDLARELAASGWRDMTRLAKGDPEMGAGILATNPRAVAERIRGLQRALDGWAERLEGAEPDPGGIESALDAARGTLLGEDVG